MRIIVPSDAIFKAALSIPTTVATVGCVGADCCEGGDCTGGICSASPEVGKSVRPLQEFTVTVES